MPTEHDRLGALVEKLRDKTGSFARDAMQLQAKLRSTLVSVLGSPDESVLLVRTEPSDKDKERQINGHTLLTEKGCVFFIRIHFGPHFFENKYWIVPTTDGCALETAAGPKLFRTDEDFKSWAIETIADIENRIGRVGINAAVVAKLEGRQVPK